MLKHILFFSIGIIGGLFLPGFLHNKDEDLMIKTTSRYSEQVIYWEGKPYGYMPSERRTNWEIEVPSALSDSCHSLVMDLAHPGWREQIKAEQAGNEIKAYLLEKAKSDPKSMNWIIEHFNREKNK